MFSYLKLVEDCLDPYLYKQGLKYYLEGSIVSEERLWLDNWYKFEVLDRQSLYTVKIPILHLALSRKKFSKAKQALSQVVSCNCSYFDDLGCCSHIVAVLAKLENDFFPKNKNPKKERGQEASQDYKPSTAGFSESIFDKMIEVDTAKKLQQYEFDLDYCLTRDLSSLQVEIKLKYFWKDFNQDPGLFVSALEAQKLKIEEILNDYTAEKRLIKIFCVGLKITQGNYYWWKFWSQFLVCLDSQNQAVLWAKLWKMSLIKITDSFKPELEQTLKGLSEDLKLEILSNLKQEFTRDPDSWINFCFVAECQAWILKNLDRLDNQRMVEAALMFPEKREQIEFKITKDIKNWIDFLTPASYEDLLKSLAYWKQNLGDSDCFQSVLKYIQENHPKKRKLLARLESI